VRKILGGPYDPHSEWDEELARRKKFDVEVLPPIPYPDDIVICPEVSRIRGFR
jgi:hypothetical protein